jgi:cellulose synthase/poly-beta-1,6-N-acetylglucosamine synthase-like glycosyltransferase
MELWPSVSVMIPAAAAANSLPTALEALAGQDDPGPIEIVVATGDEYTSRAAEGHDVIVVDNPSGHTPVGLNLAAKASTGEILIRVDAHTSIPPTYIRSVV